MSRGVFQMLVATIKVLHIEGVPVCNSTLTQTYFLIEWSKNKTSKQGKTDTFVNTQKNKEKDRVYLHTTKPSHSPHSKHYQAFVNNLA